MGAESPTLKFVPAQECLQTVDGSYLASAIELGLVPVGRDRDLPSSKFNRRSSPRVAVGLGGPPGKFLNVCPKGTDPVYRMFDDTPRHAAHQYSTGPDIVGSFVSSYVAGNPNAYQLEGVAFCSPRE